MARVGGAFVEQAADRKIGEIIIADAGLTRAHRDAGNALSLGVMRMGRQTDIEHAFPTGPGRCDHIQKFAVGTRQRNDRGGEIAAENRGFAYAPEQFLARGCAHDRFVGRTQRCQQAGEPLLVHFGGGAFGFLLQHIQSERNVLDDPPHQGDHLVIQPVRTAEEEIHDRCGLAADEQRKHRTRRKSRLLHQRQPRLRARIVRHVVAETGLAGPERRSTHALSLRNRGIAGEAQARCDFGIYARLRGQPEPGGIRLGHEDGGAEQFSLLDGGFTDALEHFLFRARPHDGFVGRGEGGKHPGDARRRIVAVKIVERKGDVFGHALEQADRFLVQRVGLVEIDEQRADRFSVPLDRRGGGRPRSDLARLGMPASGPLVIDIVVGYAGAAGTKG